jgi:hypothetical protein
MIHLMTRRWYFCSTRLMRARRSILESLTSLRTLSTLRRSACSACELSAEDSASASKKTYDTCHAMTTHRGREGGREGGSGTGTAGALLSACQLACRRRERVLLQAVELATVLSHM